MASISTNLNVKVQGKALFATANGLKVGSKGKVIEDETIMGALTKGEARRVRKALRKTGHYGKARKSVCRTPASAEWRGVLFGSKSDLAVAG